MKYASSLRLRHRYVSHILRHLVAPLHGRTVGNRHVPALDLGVFFEIDGLPFVTRDPGPDGDVGNRIVAGDELAALQSAVEHAVEAMRLLEEALFRLRRLALVVFHEMVDLAEHRARS